MKRGKPDILWVRIFPTISEREESNRQQGQIQFQVWTCSLCLECEKWLLSYKSNWISMWIIPHLVLCRNQKIQNVHTRAMFTIAMVSHKWYNRKFFVVSNKLFIITHTWQKRKWYSFFANNFRLRKSWCFCYRADTEEMYNILKLALL